MRQIRVTETWKKDENWFSKKNETQWLNNLHYSIVCATVMTKIVLLCAKPFLVIIGIYFTIPQLMFLWTASYCTYPKSENKLFTNLSMNEIENFKILMGVEP
jgi:hypothetical protein